MTLFIEQPLFCCQCVRFWFVLCVHSHAIRIDMLAQQDN